MIFCFCTVFTQIGVQMKGLKKKTVTVSTGGTMYCFILILLSNLMANSEDDLGFLDWRLKSAIRLILSDHFTHIFPEFLVNECYLSHRPTAKAQASLCIHTVLHEPSLFAHTVYEPSHGKTYLCNMGTTKAQISTFVVRCQDKDQDSLLVKRRNDNHSPGRVIRESVPSAHHRSELSSIVIAPISKI